MKAHMFSFRVQAMKDISKQNVIEICQSLETKTTLKWEPLRRVDGFIGSGDLTIRRRNLNCREFWPYVSENSSSEWENDDYVIFAKNTVLDIRLRDYGEYGSIKWTSRLARHVPKVFEEHGLKKLHGMAFWRGYDRLRVADIHEGEVPGY